MGGQLPEMGKFITDDTHADVAVVIVTFNSAVFIADLIGDLRIAAHDLRLRLIVVDNKSVDGTTEVVRRHEDVSLVEPGANLGFGGGLNIGFRSVGNCDAVMILNPDLRLNPEAIPRLLSALKEGSIGATVPLILKEDGSVFPSLRREPSLARAIGDALLGNKIRARPDWSAETELRQERYRTAHDVDWATGAALLVSIATLRKVGDWWADYPIYSEETDYFRRIRMIGQRIRFVPSAVVTHHGGGSGSSPGLLALMAVNRVRYIERYHDRLYSIAFWAAVVLAAALRVHQPSNRYVLAVLANRSRWSELPAITKS